MKFKEELILSEKISDTIDSIIKQLSPGIIIEIYQTDQEDSITRCVAIKEFLPDNRILTQEMDQEDGKKSVKRVGILSFLLGARIIKIKSGTIEVETETLNRYSNY